MVKPSQRDFSCKTSLETEMARRSWIKLSAESCHRRIRSSNRAKEEKENWMPPNPRPFFSADFERWINNNEITRDPSPPSETATDGHSRADIAQNRYMIGLHSYVGRIRLRGMHQLWKQSPEDDPYQEEKRQNVFHGPRELGVIRNNYRWRTDKCLSHSARLPTTMDKQPQVTRKWHLLFNAQELTC